MSTATNHARKSLRPTLGLATVLGYASASHRRVCGLLIVFSLIAFLPGFFQIPPVDRDEPRFAQATKQMLESGQYVDIRFQDEVRYKKPVGIYWLQALAVKAGEAVGVPQARTTIWLYRLPSLFGAIGAVLLTYWTALAFVGRRTSLLAALMMASSVLLGVEARLAKTDAVLLFTCVAAMGAMARIYLMSRRTPDVAVGWRLPAILWTAMAAGVLIKGPLILMFVGLTALTLSIADRSGRWLWSLRPLAGLAWLLLLVLPWFVAILVKSGGSFIAQSVGDDMLSKVTGGQESHGAPPGYYFLLFWVTFWPGSILAGLAAPRVWQARSEPGARFLLAWLLPSWAVFEAVITKLPHYILPLYPAIAILIAGILEGGGLVTKRWLVRGTVGWFLFPAAIAIGVVAIFIIVGRDLGLVAWPTAAAATIFGLFAWWLYDAGRPRARIIARHGGLGARRRYRLCHNVSLAAGFVPERADRRRFARRRLRRAESGGNRLLSGTEPGVPARRRYPIHRRYRRRDISRPGAMPFCADRRARRAQLRGTGERDRVALYAQPARRRL